MSFVQDVIYYRKLRSMPIIFLLQNFYGIRCETIQQNARRSNQFRMCVWHQDPFKDEVPAFWLGTQGGSRRRDGCYTLLGYIFAFLYTPFYTFFSYLLLPFWASFSQLQGRCLYKTTSLPCFEAKRTMPNQAVYLKKIPAFLSTSKKRIPSFSSLYYYQTLHLVKQPQQVSLDSTQTQSQTLTFVL